MVAERHQNLFKFIDCLRHLQTEKIHPFLIDKAHIINGLDRRLFRTKLLDPGQRPDMAVYIRTHDPVLRIFVKHRFQVRHIVVDIFLQRDDCAELPVLEQVAV